MVHTLRRLLGTALVAAMVAALCGCGGDEHEGHEHHQGSQSSK